MTHSLSTRAIRLRTAVQVLLAVAAVQSSAEFGASTQQADLAQSRHALTSPASQVQRTAQTLFTVARAHARGHLGHCKQKKKKKVIRAVRKRYDPVQSNLEELFSFSIFFNALNNKAIPQYNIHFRARGPWKFFIKSICHT